MKKIYKFENVTGASDTVTITASDTGEVIDFTAGAAVTITTIGQDAGGDNTTAGNAITFSTGTIDLANTSDLTINSNGGAVTIKGIRGASSETVTINANKTGGTASATETISIGTDGIGSADQIGAIALTAADGVTLGGNITLADSAGADLTVTGAGFISGDVTIAGDNTTHDATVTFSSTIDGVAGGGDDDLIINFGDSAEGTLSLGGVIGGSQALTTLDINQSAGTAAFTLSLIHI